MTEIKLYNRWSLDGVAVQEEGLKRYISLKPVIVPKTGSRYAGNRFHKSKVNIIERLAHKMMCTGHKSKKHLISSGHHTGKALTVNRIIEDALEIIEKKTGQNPIAVFVQALENAAPREEIITIEYGGARYPKATECAPQRRVDIALRLFCQGSFQKCFDNKKAIEETLSDEIINAFNLSNQSLAISKKLETERQADASR